jgi:hypothetical protein
MFLRALGRDMEDEEARLLSENALGEAHVVVDQTDG